ncbi:MAG: glycoside hydrolase [Fusicatenibacter sp.]|nr:glycoside hydrolase [Fusicatenibacter sp.]
MRTHTFGIQAADLRPDLSKENPRNSEGAFYTKHNGEILFVYSRFKGKSNADSASADICLLCSEDDGKTFGKEKTILTCEGEEAVNIMSLSFLEMENGDIGLFYLVRSTYTRMRMYLRRSSDGGKTWGERVLCMPQDGFFVVNNDRVIRLSSGRILIPAARHAAMADHFDGRSDVVFFYSDDDGRTWKEADTKCSISYTMYCRSGLQEPGVLELSPGVLWSWARTDLGRQYEMFSLDYGEHWSACQPSQFTGPCSPLCMKRGWDGDLYAVWNPIPEYNGRETDQAFFHGGRSPLVIAKSSDQGKTFTDPIAFETDPDRGYCYCSIHFTEHVLLLAYCAGGEEDGSCLARTVIRRIEKEELDQVLQ